MQRPVETTVIDSKAFEILVREHHRRLLAYGISLAQNEVIAEDLVQDAFITAFLKLEKIDTPASFPAWMRSIIRNKYYEYCRKNREIPCPKEYIEQICDIHTGWDSKAEAGFDLIQLLHDCIGKLPETMGQVIKMFYMDRLSGHIIADMISCQVATVRKRLERARNSLGICIEEMKGAIE
ncbi:MAG: sigma-70 family RNA polymerase sigma factor [Victivallaceae bacterium]|nr:sigma-70 family RNA polymerase sigma factor [Victivallaceae bacterium]